MKYAVFASGGKQYKVAEGSVVEIEKIKAELGASISLDTVLLYAEDGAVKIGQPTLSGFAVTATVLDQIKARKIRVAKFKAKARYRKVYGHRQLLTKIKVDKIVAKSTSARAADDTEKPKTKQPRKDASAKKIS